MISAMLGLAVFFAGGIMGYAYGVAGETRKSRMAKTSDTDPRRWWYR